MTALEKLLSLVVSGGVTGAVLSILAMGLVLTYATTRIFNFAHGAVAFTTAYVYFELNSGLHWPIVPAAVVSVAVFAPLLGLLLDALLFRPLARTSETTKIVGTVGLLVALPAAFSFVIERLISTFHFGLLKNDVAFVVAGIGPSPPHVWRPIEGVSFNSDQLVVVIAAAVSALVLWFVMTRTRPGLKMRAAVDSPRLSELRGVNPVATSRLAWVLGCSLAGLAGVVAAPNPAFGLNSTNYTLVLLMAATAAVFARFRSLPLAFLGGILLGVVRNLVQGYLTWGASVPGLRSSTPFWLLFVALYFLGRDRSRRAGSIASEVPPPDYLADLSPWRRRLPWCIAGGVLVAFTLGPASGLWQGIVGRGLALGIIFLSFAVVTGQGGMVSLAQSTFVTAGALTTGLLTSHGWPFVPAVLTGGASALALGVVVALPALRLGGLPLALSTLALAYIGDQVLFQIDSYRGYTEGWVVHRPAMGGLHFTSDASMAMLLLAVVLVSTWIVLNVQRSPTGRAMAATRSASDAAAASGISTVSVRLALFGLSAFIAGVGGALFASVDGRITNLTWPPFVGLVWLAVVVTFGIRRPAGALVAGMGSYAFPRILEAGFHWPSVVPTFLSWDGTSSVLIPPILFGLGAIALAKDPDGVIATVSERRHHGRRRPSAPAHADRSNRAPAQDAALLPVSERASVSGALVLEGVRGGYGDVEVLHGIDLVLSEGRVLALLGANGGGKSTLCAAIAGQLRMTAGAVGLGGRDLTGLPAHRRAEAGLVLVPEASGVFPGLSVEENLQLWLPEPAQRTTAYERFPLLAARRKVPAGSLSGGEQQMLTVAPVVVRVPRVLIADEPTLGLAPLVTEELMRIFRELADAGTSVLIVEERATAALAVADDVAFLELGRIVWRGPRSDVDAERLASVYLGGDPEDWSMVTDEGSR